MDHPLITKKHFRRAFEDAWNELYGLFPVQLDKAYAAASPRTWTEFMFGREPKAIGGRSLLERAIERLSAERITFEFDRERHGVDVFGRIHVGPKNIGHAGYLNVVMIEIENDTRKSYEEFWKLLHARCPLRVLITYELRDAAAHELAFRTYEQMYQAARKYLGTDDPDAYLVVVGSRSGTPPRIRWRFYELVGERSEVSAAAPR